MREAPPLFIHGFDAAVPAAADDWLLPALHAGAVCVRSRDDASPHALGPSESQRERGRLTFT